MLSEVSVVPTCLLLEKESACGHEHGHFRDFSACDFFFKSVALNKLICLARLSSDSGD